MSSPASDAFLALFKKELRAFFDAPGVYLVAVAFLLTTGYFFSTGLLLSNLSSLHPFTDLAPLLLLFFVPAVTMRLYAEERKLGTLEVLATLPVPSASVLLAKYAAALAVLAFALAATAPFPITIAVLGRLDWGSAFGSYLGLFLLGATLSAAGLMASSLTRNQFVAFIVSFMIAFPLYLIGKLDQWMPAWLLGTCDWVGYDSHVANMARGVLDARDLMYFLTLSTAFLFAAHVANSRERR